MYVKKPLVSKRLKKHMLTDTLITASIGAVNLALWSKETKFVDYGMLVCNTLSKDAALWTPHNRKLDYLPNPAVTVAKEN
jgi:hypothetical protein